MRQVTNTMRPSDFILCAIELARQVNMAKHAYDGSFENEQIALEEHFRSNESDFTYYCLAVMYIGRGDVPEWTLIDNACAMNGVAACLASVFAHAEAVDLREATRQMIENRSLPSQLIAGIEACVKRGLDINEEFRMRWGTKSWVAPQ